jgi:hypothetical protein
VIRAKHRDEVLFPMVASISRVFMNEQMHWTLQATCSECLSETLAPLIMGVPIECSGCGLVVKIDPGRTVFHRSEGAGHAPESLRRFRWGIGLLRPLPGAIACRPL